MQYIQKTTLIIFAIFISIANKTVLFGTENKDLKIWKVLPQDAIQSIKNPHFVSANEANIHPDEPVIGLSVGGHNRAYSVYLLNSHEIVNDVVCGKPIAVTW